MKHCYIEVKNKQHQDFLYELLTDAGLSHSSYIPQKEISYFALDKTVKSGWFWFGWKGACDRVREKVSTDEFIDILQKFKNIPKVGDKYKHKNGNIYIVSKFAKESYSLVCIESVTGYLGSSYNRKLTDIEGIFNNSRDSFTKYED